MVVRLLVTPAKARAAQAVEVEAMPMRTEVNEVSRPQNTPVAAVMLVGAVAARPTTTRTHGEEDAGTVVRNGTARPLSGK